MRRSAFTLIELLIVVAIIGILAAIAVPNFQKASQRALISRGIADMRTTITAYRMYLMDGNKQWPQHKDSPDAMNPLTTPIAYLSGPIFDAFLEKSQRHVPISLRTHGGIPHLEFSNGFWRGGEDRNHFLKFKESDNILFMHGPGAVANLIYTASNGVFSDGWLLYMMEEEGKPIWGDPLGSVGG